MAKKERRASKAGSAQVQTCSSRFTGVFNEGSPGIAGFPACLLRSSDGGFSPSTALASHSASRRI